VSSRRRFPGHRAPSLSRSLSLPSQSRILYNRAIRGIRPGLNGRSQQFHLIGMLMWQGQSVRRPVLPPLSNIDPFRRVRRACRRNRANIGKDTHALYELFFSRVRMRAPQQVEKLTTR